MITEHDLIVRRIALMGCFRVEGENGKDLPQKRDTQKSAPKRGRGRPRKEEDNYSRVKAPLVEEYRKQYLDSPGTPLTSEDVHPAGILRFICLVLGVSYTTLITLPPDEAKTLILGAIRNTS
ncbi:hypothetical protein LCGC14_1687340 [marine sediment metagenome]|uniref:Uncharacterized protein n=1 Tax=marine sediment metagenome TaxID=412755 RepID=A0A0F9I9D0_9ZZZZ